MKHLGTRAIETERLTLRRFAEGDAGAMFRNWANDPEVTKHLTWPPHKDINGTMAILGEWIPQYERDDFYSWCIALKSLGEPIGSISCVYIGDAVKMARVGYCIGKSWWGRGIAAEALGAVIKFLLTEAGFNRVEACHNPHNPNSGKVMQKCGMKYEGTLRQDTICNIGVCDSVCYGILAEDYISAE